MIHGMFGTEKIWRNYKTFFEKRNYTCITPNLRLHITKFNEVPPSRLGTVSILDYIQDLEKEIYKLNVLPIIMGHSMGGLLAQILASRGLAKALVLLTPTPPYGIMSIRYSALKGFWSIITKWGFWKRPICQTFDEAVHSMFHLLPLKEQKQVFNEMVYESGRVLLEIGLWFLDSKKASKVDESKVNCPVLVIAGSEDRIIPPSIVRRVADKYKSTYKEFSNHAHWVIGEPGWQEIANYIFNWLKQSLKIRPLAYSRADRV